MVDSNINYTLHDMTRQIVVEASAQFCSHDRHLRVQIVVKSKSILHTLRLFKFKVCRLLESYYNITTL